MDFYHLEFVLDEFFDVFVFVYSFVCVGFGEGIGFCGVSEFV